MPRLTVDLSSEIDKTLSQIAANNHTTKAEVMRKAFALLAVAEEEKGKGNSMAIVKEDENREAKIVAKLIGI